MGIILVKAKLFSQLVLAVAALKRSVEFVILQLMSVVLDHMLKRKIMKVNGKSAWNGFNLGLSSYHVALKYQVSLSRSFFAGLVFLPMSQFTSYKCFLVVL